MDEDLINVALPKVIVEKIKKHIQNSRFSSVSQYIVFILNEVMGDESTEDKLTPEEEEQVKLTLKKLGYLKSE